MSKAIAGAAMIAAAAAIFVMSVVFPVAAVAGSMLFMDAMFALAAAGVSMEAGAVADALTNNRGMNITTRQAAGLRQIVYGEQRIGGNMVYESSTGGTHNQFNTIIVLAGHEIDSIVNLYLDGRQVPWVIGSAGNTTRNGVNFGGDAAPVDLIGPGGQWYNFGGRVYCEARYGDQSPGDVMSSMTANDPTWTTNQSGSPYLGGCAYVYLKTEFCSMFPTRPEIRFTIRGKNNIIDPRIPTTSSPPPTVVQRPTTFLNGWDGGIQQAAYEEGVDQAYNWGFNYDRTFAYDSPESAYDGNILSASSISFRHTHQYAGCIWTFAALAGVPPAQLWLNINSMVNPYVYSGRSAGIWYSINAGVSWTQVYNTPNHSQKWDCIHLSSSQDCSQVRVMAFTDSHDDMAHFVYDIQLADGQQANASVNGGVFTNNWALIVSDILQDVPLGLGDVGSVNTAQLIAAANVCDEQVTLANGNTELRWACNWHCDTGTSPGDMLQTIMSGAAGRLSRIAGEWYIWPAYWQGPSFVFDGSILAGNVQWKPYRKQRDLFNRVNGTYIAPNYPYNVAGNLYDRNNWYAGTTQDNFPFSFQPTSYPQFACDVLHGYKQDQYLAQDNGIQLPREVSQPSVLSVSQAQRAAKVILMRNRQQGSGTLSMQLGAWKMQPLDVMLLSFTGQNWRSKQLEIVSTKFMVDKSDAGAPKIMFNCNVQETNQSVYEWAVREEMSVYDVPANPYSGFSYVVPPPTAMSLASNTTTALVANDGTITPRILMSWVAAPDALIAQYNIQFKKSADTVWTDAPAASAIQTFAFISGVLVGVSYDIRINAMRGNTITSLWLYGTVVVAAPNSTLNSYSTTPIVDLSNPTSTTVVMGAVVATFGVAAVHYSTRTFTIPTPTVPTWYYVTIADPTQQGETSATLTATCQTSNALVGVQGNTYIGAIQVIAAGGSTNALAGGWPAPTTFTVGA